LIDDGLVYSEVYTWGDLRGAFPKKEAQLRGKRITKIACMALLTLALTGTKIVLEHTKSPQKIPGEFIIGGKWV
jgi:hypothetical protein